MVKCKCYVDSVMCDREAVKLTPRAKTPLCKYCARSFLWGQFSFNMGACTPIEEEKKECCREKCEGVHCKGCTC